MINQKTLPDSPGQVNFPARHVTLKAYYLPNGQESRQKSPSNKIIN